MPDSKRCYVCKQFKPLAEFCRDAHQADLHARACKACHAERNRRYYQTHKIAVCARTSQYQESHPEIKRKTKANYKAKHLTQWLADTRERSAAWRKDHRDVDRAAARRWCKEHPDAYRAIQMRRKARKRGCEGDFSADEWQAVKAQYAFRCLRCGRSEPDIILTVDHVVPLAMGGSNYINNIQPLCGPCNAAKGAREIVDYRN